MVKNKVRTPAHAKNKRLPLPKQRAPKFIPQTLAIHSTPFHGKDAVLSTDLLAPDATVARSDSKVYASHTTSSHMPSQTASSLIVHSDETHDRPLTLSSPHATTSGCTSSHTINHLSGTISVPDTNPSPSNADTQLMLDIQHRSSCSAWENDHSAITDHVYAHAAAIYDHAREESRTGSGLVRYRQKRETPPCTPPDTSPKEQRQAYQLALNTLKCEWVIKSLTAELVLPFWCRTLHLNKVVTVKDKSGQLFWPRATLGL